MPGIAGQSPVTIARQLYLMATGERAGAWAPLMKGVVEKLTNEDIVAISAFVASTAWLRLTVWPPRRWCCCTRCAAGIAP